MFKGFLAFNTGNEIKNSLLQYKTLIRENILELGGNPDDEYDCFRISENINELPSLWGFITVNWYWLSKTLLRMHGSGLQEKWNQWSFWAQNFVIRNNDGLVNR